MSIVPKKHNKKKRKELFLFDPITTERKPVDYDYLDGLVDIPSNQLSVYICKKKPLYQLGAFLCNEDISRNELIDLMTKWRGKEVKHEIWKSLSGGKTQVSSLGRFRNLQKDGSYKFIMPGIMTGGHLRIKVWIDDVYGFKNASRLIAELFVINNDILKTYVIHKNGLQYDNRVNNLEWVTQRAAMQKANKAMKDRINPVYKIDIDTGKVVDQYDNPQEAADDNFVSRKCITMALSGKLQTSAGYKWARG